MKNLFVFFLLLLFNISAFAEAQWELPKDIELEGYLEFDRGKSLVFPLEASITNSEVAVTFFDALTDVTITITSQVSGAIQARTVSFLEFQTESFDLSKYPKGACTISITTPRGTNLHGSFTIE